MHAIPSRTPLLATAPWTSSVMSVTVRPPAVRSLVSCWKTFIAPLFWLKPPPGQPGRGLPQEKLRCTFFRGHDRSRAVGMRRSIKVAIVILLGTTGFLAAGAVAGTPRPLAFQATTAPGIDL